MTDVPEARVQRRRFAPIWLVPIAAVAIAGWLGVKTLTQRGPLVTITFASAEGVEAGRTRIMLRNVEVGMVEFLDLSRDLSHVEVHARMRNDLKDHLTTGARFWVVRPRLGVGGVSGLGTLFSGAYVEMEPGPGRRTEQFKGLEEPPVLPPSGDGKTFVLRAKSLGSLTRGSPVYYRGVPVGETLGATLAQDARSVAVSVFVRAPHDQLVHPETRFWNASGIEVSTGGAGFKARVESLQAVILGGIAFDTRPEDADAPPSPKDTEFELYPDKDTAQNTPYGPQVSYLVHFTGSVRGVDVGTPVELLGIRVGRVTDVRLEGEAGRIRVPVTVTLEPGAGPPPPGRAADRAGVAAAIDGRADGAARRPRTAGRAPDLEPAHREQGGGARLPSARAEGPAHPRRPVPGDSHRAWQRVRRSLRVGHGAARRRATDGAGGKPGAALARARRDDQEPRRPHPRGERAHRADDGEPPGGVRPAREDAVERVRTARQLDHRLGRAPARAA